MYEWIDKHAKSNTHVNMKQVFPSPSPVPSRSLSRTFTPLAKAFCAKNNPSDITIVSSKQPFETYILYYFGRSEKKKWHLHSSQEATLGTLHFALFCAQHCKILDICGPLKKQPLENDILQYVERSEDKFWTYATTNEDSRLTTANTRSKASTQIKKQKNKRFGRTP